MGSLIGVPHARGVRLQRVGGDDPRDPRGLHRQPPAVLVHRPVADRLEVLLGVALGSVRVGQRIGERHAVHRLLLDPVDVRRHRNPGDVEDRRADVDRVGEMRPERTGFGDPLGPVHDERVARAAEMRADLLSPLKRRVARPRPRRRVVRIHHRAAPRVDTAVALRELELHLVGQRDPVLHRQLVERAGDRALHAGAVIPPDPQHERVLQLAELLDRVDHPADVVIRVLGETRVHLHLARVKRLQLVRDVVPRGERIIARRQLRIGRDHPERLLPGERLLTQLVPTLIELALVLRRPRLGNVMRGVAAARGEVREERLLGVLSPG